MKALRRRVTTSEKARRIIRNIQAPPPLWALGRLLERALSNQGAWPTWPPIFVVGPARSGTTLIYQGLTQAFRVSYFSNLAAWFPMCPGVVGSTVARVGGCEPPPSFESRYGKTRGWRAPSQANRVWQRWFRKVSDISERAPLTAAEARELNSAIAALEHAVHAPFVAKSPGFSGYLRSLAAAVPDALFIRVRRDPLQIAQSVLRGRRELFGDAQVSISRLPSGFQRFAQASYLEQICAYVLMTEATLDRDTEAAGLQRVFPIWYEDFCNRPRDCLAQFQLWYFEHGSCVLEARNPIPERFECANGQKISHEEYTGLEQCLNALRASVSSAAPQP